MKVPGSLNVRSSVASLRQSIGAFLQLSLSLPRCLIWGWRVVWILQVLSLQNQIKVKLKKHWKKYSRKIFAAKAPYKFSMFIQLTSFAVTHLYYLITVYSNKSNFKHAWHFPSVDNIWVELSVTFIFFSFPCIKHLTLSRSCLRAKRNFLTMGSFSVLFF